MDGRRFLSAVAAGAAGATIVSLAVGCGSDAPAAAPLLLQPAGGAWTGSVWAERSLRPRFQWTGVRGAVRYQIQVDDSCASPETCAFPSPEIDATTAATELEPDVPLAVSQSPPVGRRYFWRVRACADAIDPSAAGADAACGPWSRVRYANVGRQRQDFNGDGYGDLVVASSSFFIPGSEDVFFGGPSGVLAGPPGWTIAGDRTTVFVGGPVVWPGDMDGDGFSDLAFLGARPDGVALLRVYTGGTSPAMTPAIELEDVDGFGSLQWVSDVNGDGFDDLLFSRSSIDEILLGGQPLGAGIARELQLPIPSDLTTLPLAIGDINHDGNADLFRARPGGLSWLGWIAGVGTDPAETPLSLPAELAKMRPIAYLGDPLDRGATLLFFSAEPRLRAATFTDPADPAAGRCDADLAPPSGSFPGRTAVAPLGDVDGDGHDDFAVGDPVGNQVRVYSGACGFPSLLTLAGPPPRDPAFPTQGPRNGDAVASPGDMDGDGYPDLAVSSLLLGVDASFGQVYLYRGGPTVDPTPAAILPSASAAPEGFAAALD